MTTTKVILDIDNALTLPVQDTDDAIALALALVSPELEVVGITTCAGNCTAAQSTVNTLRLLQLADAAAIPVAEGRADPLIRDRRGHFRYLAAKTAGDEAHYWRSAPQPPEVAISPLSMPAHEFINRTIALAPGEITYIALGSFTNLALALLTAPDLAPRIKQVVHMGGAFHPSAANPFVWSTPDIPDEVWRNTLRFNTTFDPEASVVVFRAGVPLIFITVNVTRLAFQRPEHLVRLAAVPTPFHRFLYAHIRPWVEWSMAERRLPGAHMHDPLCLRWPLFWLPWRSTRNRVQSSATCWPAPSWDRCSCLRSGWNSHSAAFFYLLFYIVTQDPNEARAFQQPRSAGVRLSR